MFLFPLFFKVNQIWKGHLYSHLFLVPVISGNKPSPKFISIARVLFITIYLFLLVGELSHKSTLGTGMHHPLTVDSAKRSSPNETDKNQSIRSRKTSHRIPSISRNWCYTAETEQDHAVCSILWDFLICCFDFLDISLYGCHIGWYNRKFVYSENCFPFSFRDRFDVTWKEARNCIELVDSGWFKIMFLGCIV